MQSCSADNHVMFSLQMPVNSHWTKTQPTQISFCLGTTEMREWLVRTWGGILILVTQRDLTTIPRCCVERV